MTTAGSAPAFERAYHLDEVVAAEVTRDALRLERRLGLGALLRGSPSSFPAFERRGELRVRPDEGIETPRQRFDFARRLVRDRGTVDRHRCIDRLSARLERVKTNANATSPA